MDTSRRRNGGGAGSGSGSCWRRDRQGHRRVGGEQQQQRRRHDMNERTRARSVQIRRKRKEEILFQRRRANDNLPFQQHHQQQQGAGVPGAAPGEEEFSRLVRAFLGDGSSSADAAAALQVMQQSLSMGAGNGVKGFFRKLLEENETAARQLVARVAMPFAAASGDVGSKALELSFLADLCLVDSASASPSTDEHLYYGSAPLAWRDVILQHQPSIIPQVMALLSQPSSSAATTHQKNEQVAQLIVNLVVQDEEDQQASSTSSSAALREILPFWPQLVAALPATSAACAAVIRTDRTSYGTDFLRCLSPARLAALLGRGDGGEDPAPTAIYAAWMLESLSRREDAAVDAMCCGDGALVRALVSRISAAEAGRFAAPDRDAFSRFLVPALRAVGNIVTSCQGRYVELFLRDEAFCSALSGLLKRHVLGEGGCPGGGGGGYAADALWLTGCLLCDAGTPGHAATDAGVPVFVPMLVAVLTSAGASFELKRGAVAALNNAVSDPPEPDDGETHQQQKHDPARSASGSLVEANLNKIVEEELWEFSVRERLMDVLVELLSVPDDDAVWNSIEIVDRILRSIPESLLVFETAGGVDKLEEICNDTDRAGIGKSNCDGDALEALSAIAADLLDDFFDRDDEEDREGEEHHLAPAVEGGEFVFGLNNMPSPAGAAAFMSPPAPAFGGPAQMAGGGRGRGRTMPAWMMKQQQDQQQMT